MTVSFFWLLRPPTLEPGLVPWQILLSLSLYFQNLTNAQHLKGYSLISWIIAMASWWGFLLLLLTSHNLFSRQHPPPWNHISHYSLQGPKQGDLFWSHLLLLFPSFSLLQILWPLCCSLKKKKKGIDASEHLLISFA